MRSYCTVTIAEVFPPGCRQDFVPHDFGTRSQPEILSSHPLAELLGLKRPSDRLYAGP